MAWYAQLCMGLVHVAVVLALLNFCAGLYLRAKERRPRAAHNIVVLRYGTNALAAAYPDLNAKQVNRLLDETWNRQLFEYEPFVQFREKPFAGRYVNVHWAGFRRSKNQGPWPPDPAAFNLFLFGGSIVFGYGLPDEQTLGSHLQEVLAARTGRDVRVYNFGRGFYYSTLERLLLEKLLLAGHRPGLALFVDGANDFSEGGSEPFMTKSIRKMVDRANQRSQTGDSGFACFQQLPLVRMIRELKSSAAAGETTSLMPSPSAPEAPAAAGKPAQAPKAPPAGTDPADAIIRQYLANKRMTEAAGRAFSVPAAFVWAPTPYYKYDLQYHPFANPTNLEKRYTAWAKGYQRMAAHVQTNSLGSNFIWCADIQEGVAEQLYVDGAHYNSRMGRRLAETIADELSVRGLVPAARREAPPEPPVPAGEGARRALRTCGPS